MQFGLETRPEDLLTRFVERLQVKTGLSTDRVFETLAEDQDHLEFPPADQFITVTPQRFVRSQPLFAGAGRYAAGFDGQIRVATICRFQIDPERRSTQELRNKVRSTLAVNLKVVDALDGWNMPNDAGTGSYLREPIACLSYDVLPKRVKGGGPWSVVASVWSVKFVQTLPSGTSI